MNKEELIMRGLMDLLNKWGWLNKTKMEGCFKGYKSSEIHYIEYIGRNADSNLTKFAEAFYMTRGAVSKITRKLTDKGLVESYQKPDNRKEIYFRLTRQGKQIDKIHKGLHKEFGERDKAVFAQLSGKQLDDMLGFIGKYKRHLDAEIKKLDMNT